MTFVFQDSTEMPYQKNFIADINNFLSIVEQTLPIENRIIELKNQIQEEEEKFEKEITMLNSFLSGLNISLDQLTTQYDIEPTAKCKDKVKESGVECVEKQKEQFKIALDDLTRNSKDEVARMSSQIHNNLEPFLWSGVYNTKMVIHITSNPEKLVGKITMKLSGFSFTYETTYADFPFQVKKFMNEISIPILSRGGLIHKENRIKQTDVSDYFIKRVYIDEDFQLDLENKKGTKKVNLLVPGEIENAILTYVEEQAIEITKNEELAPKLNLYKLDELRKKVVDYVGDETNIISRTLVKIELDDNDAIESNELFECVKIIASQYGEIINDIFAHSIIKKEIAIKEIVEGGIRNEIFISVDEMSNRLSALGGDGLELKGILNI
ncbi:MAG: hypothetical protein KAR85_00085 [Methanosarcinales archaeon]|nr:hypothetical protein [Methanosarcinales archaeon]